MWASSFFLWWWVVCVCVFFYRGWSGVITATPKGVLSIFGGVTIKHQTSNIKHQASNSHSLVLPSKCPTPSHTGCTYQHHCYFLVFIFLMIHGRPAHLLFHPPPPQRSKKGIQREKKNSRSVLTYVCTALDEASAVGARPEGPSLSPHLTRTNFEVLLRLDIALACSLKQQYAM